MVFCNDVPGSDREETFGCSSVVQTGFRKATARVARNADKSLRILYVVVFIFIDLYIYISLIPSGYFTYNQM